VTVSGPGGVGKTRLALELARRQVPRRADGVWLVDLGAGPDTLLVLDNCEHVIEACARLTDALLTSCPNVRILATSREVLDVRGSGFGGCSRSGVRTRGGCS